MADNIISQYYTKNDGSQIGNDAQLINGVYQNEKIINKNSGEKFVKSSNYRNVFDKVDEKISKIDDANANGVCSCKNTSGVEVDTFKCHVPVSNSAPTLNWGQTSTIGTVDGKPLTVKMPGNPNTDTRYSAGTGLTLSGTTFSISQELLDKINNGGSGGSYVSWYTLLEVNIGNTVSSSDLHSDYSIEERVISYGSAGPVTEKYIEMNGIHPENGTYKITYVRGLETLNRKTVSKVYIEKIA